MEVRRTPRPDPPMAGFAKPKDGVDQLTLALLLGPRQHFCPHLCGFVTRQCHRKQSGQQVACPRLLTPRPWWVLKLPALWLWELGGAPPHWGQ